MKKILSILMVLLGISLVGCSKNKTEKIEVNAYSDSSGYISQTTRAIEGKNGFYFISTKFGKSYIEYMDPNYDEVHILCSKINCEHLSHEGVILDDCDANIGSVLYNSLNYFENYLYYIGRDSASYLCSLYKVSSDGSEHIKVCDLGITPDESNIYFSYVVTDNYIFYTQSIGSENVKNDASLIKVDIKDRSKEVLYHYEDMYAALFDLKISNNHLFFRKSSNNNLQYSQLCKFRLADRKVDSIVDNICSYTIKADKLTYWKVEDGIYVSDIDGNNKSKIFISDKNTMLGNIANMGENYYFENIANTSFDATSENISGELIQDKLQSIIQLKQEEQMILPLYVARDRVLVEVWKKGGGHYKGYYKIQEGILDNNVVIVDCIK